MQFVGGDKSTGQNPLRDDTKRRKTVRRNAPRALRSGTDWRALGPGRSLACGQRVLQAPDTERLPARADNPAGVMSLFTPRWFSRRAFLALLTLSLAAAQPENSRTRAPRRVPIEGLKEPLSNLKLSDFDGRDVSAQLKPETDGRRVTVTVAQLDPFIVKPKTIATIAMPSNDKTVLPGGIVVPLVAAPDESTPAKSGWFRLTLATSPSPATWNGVLGRYVTALTFGLRRPPDLPESIQLERPVLVKFAFEAMTADAVPPFTIEQPGLEHEKTIELHFRPNAPAPKLLIRSTLSDVDVALEALDRLELRPLQREMLGFGLESVDVAVEHVFPYGAPKPVDAPLAVTLESDTRARPEPIGPSIPAGAARTDFRVRSSGLGPVTITATAAGLQAQTVIEQRFPTTPLIAVLFGGALGGYARRFVKGARRSLTVRRVGEGGLVALIAFVAGVVGVGAFGLPAAVVGTEAGAFLVGALAGFTGVTLLERLSRRPAME